MTTAAGVLHANASDAWAYYQIRGLKAVLARDKGALWAVLQKTAPPDFAKEESHNLAEQKALKLQASGLEHERDTKSAEADGLLHQHHYLAQSVALLQVAIALGAVAALTRKRPAWWVSLCLGLAGSGLFAYALLIPH
jgi:hypothetical protein